MFNISEFKTNALKRGLLKQNLYEVDFTTASLGDTKALKFFTEAVNIPSVDMDTQQIRRYGYGPVENVAFRPVFTPMNMTFIVESGKKNILDSVITFMSSITNFMDYATMSTNSTNGLPYEVAYKEEYQFNLKVTVFNEQEDDILLYTFRDCYARQISGVGLAWAANDAYVKADVMFQYTDFSITSKNPKIKSTNSSTTNQVLTA